MTTEEILRRLNAKRVGSSMLAKCPGHEDKTASLSITESDGKTLMNCHAGCDFARIVRAMGLAPSDFFEDDGKPQASTKPRIVAEYDYRSENGELLFQSVRFEPKDFRQRQPKDGAWQWNLRGVDRVLYRLPELRALKPGTRVYVVEGEKDADRLSKLGLEATCNPGGAGRGKWLSSYVEQLRGLSVVVLPDNDESGRIHAKGIVESMPDATICELPGLPSKGDVSNWLDAGGTASELRRLSNPNRVAGFESFSDRLDDATDQRAEHIKSIIPFNISYLDDCLYGIHPTDLIIIGAATGAGKTTLAALLAQKTAMTGKRVYFFALEAFKTEIETRVLFRAICALANEAGAYQPWMTLAGWMYGKCPELDKYQETAKEMIRERMRTLHTYYRGSKFTKDDISEMFAAIKGKADLIVLDHLHYVDTDGPENSELKKIVQAIRDSSLATGVPVVVVAHLRKNGTGAGAREIPSKDDIHGSSEVMKIATKIIMVSPAQSEEFVSESPGLANTFMQVVKARYAGVNGYAALMRYDLAGLSYRRGYTVCRVGMDGKVSMAEKRPGWAGSALR